MKRKARAMALFAALGGGCMSSQKVAEPAAQPHIGPAGTVKAVPNVVGPWGEPVPARAGKKPAESGVKQAKAEVPAGDNNIQQVVGFGPAQGAMPMPSRIPGVVAATGALVNGANPYNLSPYGLGRTSVRFASPAGMKVAWQMGPGFGPTMVEAPGRYNFPQGAAYRLKLTDFPNRPGVELYPTIEVIPASLKTATFLAHSAVPLNITEEDLEQVTGGNFVVKVIYLPDPAFQDLTAVGPDEVVSSRLEPGVDPVVEAQRRGSILLILRIGNIDLEAPNTPAIHAPASPGGGMGGGGMGSDGMGDGMGGPGCAPGGMGGNGCPVPGGAMPGPMMDGQVLPGPVMQGDGVPSLPPGALPPGAIPHGALPPGAIPPGALPPGALPPGALPPGARPNTAPPMAFPDPVKPAAGRITAGVEGAAYRTKKK